MDVTLLLVFANELIIAATAVLSFSLAVYILANNFRSQVALGFVALLGSLLIVYVGDLVLPYVTHARSAQRWLRLQWLGIAFMPVAYLHLSYAILQATGYPSQLLRGAVIGSYGLSFFFVLLAWFSNLLIRPGQYSPPINQMAPGPFFAIFVLYYLLTLTLGTHTVYRARQRALTQVARRRITRMALAFTLPGLAVFPYLVVTSSRTPSLTHFVLLITFFGNILVALALVVIAYTVAYYGVLTPDRVVKRNLVRFLLSGPFLAVSVISATLVILRLDSFLHIPREVLLIFTVTGLIVVGQGIIHVLMPWVDRLVYPQDRQELDWLEELDRRLLTSSDLSQYLNNTLITLCEHMRAEYGFILVAGEDAWHVQAVYGPAEPALSLLTPKTMAQILREAAKVPPDAAWPFVPFRRYLIAPLRMEEGDIIGIVGVTPAEPLQEDAEARATVRTLLQRARAAVENRHLQQHIFALLQRTVPTIIRLQQMHATSAMLNPGVASPAVSASEADFVNWVRDALRHFWGGPKLSENPLLELQVVAKEAEQQGTHRTRALQNVLLRAIERLRPSGKRRMTASEWLLYNILELKFIQGNRVQDVAHRLAMSESDLYRKQRVAIAEVARVLREMEVEHLAHQDNGPADT